MDENIKIYIKPLIVAYLNSCYAAAKGQNKPHDMKLINTIKNNIIDILENYKDYLYID